MSPTPRQIRAAQLLPESSCLREALMKAGYPETTAKKPKMITKGKGFKEAAEPIVKQLEKLRKQAIRRAHKIGNKAGYADAVRAIDTMTKNIQLLGGKPTEIYDDYANLTTEELIKRRAGYRARTTKQESGKS